MGRGDDRLSIDIEVIKAKIDELRNTIAEASSEALKEITKGAFDKYPELENFSWTQWQPGFNGGDACIFKASVSPYEIDINLPEALESSYDTEVDYDEGGYEDADGNWIVLDSIRPPWVDEAKREISEALSVMKSDGWDNPDTFFLQMFGDSCRVIVSRTGYKVVDIEIPY